MRRRRSSPRLPEAHGRHATRKLFCISTTTMQRWRWFAAPRVETDSNRYRYRYGLNSENSVSPLHCIFIPGQSPCSAFLPSHQLNFKNCCSGCTKSRRKTVSIEVGTRRGAHVVMTSSRYHLEAQQESRRWAAARGRSRWPPVPSQQERGKEHDTSSSTLCLSLRLSHVSAASSSGAVGALVSCRGSPCHGWTSPTRRWCLPSALCVLGVPRPLDLFLV